MTNAKPFRVGLYLVERTPGGSICYRIVISKGSRFLFEISRWSSFGFSTYINKSGRRDFWTFRQRP